jgi:hypothetical protein
MQSDDPVPALKIGRKRGTRIHVIYYPEDGAPTVRCGSTSIRIKPTTPILDLTQIVASITRYRRKGHRPKFLTEDLCRRCLEEPGDDPVLNAALALFEGLPTYSVGPSPYLWSGAGAEGVDIADREAPTQPVVRDESRVEKPVYPVIGSTRQRRARVPKWDQ